MQFLLAALGSYVVQLPLYVIWLVGLVLALSHRRKRPQTARLVMVAIVLLLVTSLVGTYLDVWLPLALHERFGLSFSRMSGILALKGGLQSLIQAMAWGLLFFAIFRHPNGE